MTVKQIDADFLQLPLQQLADCALSLAGQLGASHADFRIERNKSQGMYLRDINVENLAEAESTGFAVRVIKDGTWGFASGVELSVDEVMRATRQAIEVAELAYPLNADPVELAPEPTYPNVTWVSSYEIDPFEVATAEKVERLSGLAARLIASPHVNFVNSNLRQYKDIKFYADSAGTSTTQQRVRVFSTITATNISSNGGFESLRTLAQPVGRGWEWMVGGPQNGNWDWDGEIDALGELLGEKAASPSVEAGNYDLVIDSTNLWLTIHESVGHATELDRALGYEAAYAGTTFATLDKLGNFQYGSELMNVTGDRTAEHGLATFGYDDEGVKTQQWDLVRDGIFVGYQTDRRIAQQNAAALGVNRSNGCSFASGPNNVPIQRMANVSLQPDPNGPSTEAIIAGVENGIYVVGDDSWSIDTQRYNFQFTGQRFHRIRNGKLVGQVKDLAYQATTTDFWRSMEVVGGPETYVLNGAFNCGKGQPGQVAATSHGSPTALFRNVCILNSGKNSHE